MYTSILLSHGKEPDLVIHDNMDGFKYTILNEMFQEEENKYGIISPLCGI